MSLEEKILYDFPPFRIDPARRVLLRDDEPVPTPPKVFDTLMLLVRNRGSVVTKEDLLKSVWPGTFVEEASLSNSISAARKLLGERSGQHRFIVTVPGLGYQFVAPVTETRDAASAEIAAVAPQISRSRDRSWAREKWIWLVVGMAMVAALVTSLWIFRRTPGKVKAVAVLPFQVLGPEQEHLGIALADALITGLGNFRQLEVRPTSAVLKFGTGWHGDAAGAARQLHADTVVEGRVQPTGGRLRVTLQVVRAADTRTVWTASFDRPSTEVLALEDEITRGMTEAFAMRLNEDDRQRALHPRPWDNQAYRTYLQARYFWNKRSPESLRKSIELIQQAIARESRMAPAYATLAHAYEALGEIGAIARLEARDKALAAANRALELDANLAEAHAVLATIRVTYDWQWREAEQAFLQALALNPNDSTTHQWYAEMLSDLGRFEEARAEIRRAEELDPVSTVILSAEGTIRYLGRDYAGAVRTLRQTIEMSPEMLAPHVHLGMCYIALQSYANAEPELMRARALARGAPHVDALIAYVKAASENAPAASAILQDLIQQKVSPLLLATVETGLGHRDSALVWLEEAYKQHAPFMESLKSEPLFDSLRSDSRFAELLKKMGYPM